jgi:hypothetical protein
VFSTGVRVGQSLALEVKYAGLLGEEAKQLFCWRVGMKDLTRSYQASRFYLVAS